MTRPSSAGYSTLMYNVWHFARVQKTAGDSFRTHLHDLFSANDICPHMFEYQLRADPSPRRYRLYTGHISIAAMRAVVPDAKLLLLLRDPRERLVSAYHYWRENAENGANAANPFFVRIKQMSFIEYLISDDPLIRASRQDVQARMLAGGRFGDSDAGRTGIYGPKLTPADVVSEAKRTIDGAFFVGLQHRFNASVAGLMMKVGRPPPSEMKFVNAGRSRQSFDGGDDAVKAALRSSTELDQAVFDYACEKFAT